MNTTSSIKTKKDKNTGFKPFLIIVGLLFIIMFLLKFLIDYFVK